jgi:hypothetical protein
MQYCPWQPGNYLATPVPVRPVYIDRKLQCIITLNVGVMAAWYDGLKKNSQAVMPTD